MKTAAQFVLVGVLGACIAGLAWRVSELQDELAALKSAGPSRHASEAGPRAAGRPPSQDGSERIDRLEGDLRTLADRMTGSSPADPAAGPGAAESGEPDGDETPASDGAVAAPGDPDDPGAALLSDPKAKAALTAAVEAILAEREKKEEAARAEERRKRAIEMLTRVAELNPQQTDLAGKALTAWLANVKPIPDDPNMTREAREAAVNAAFADLDNQVGNLLTAEQRAKYDNWKRWGGRMLIPGAMSGRGGGDMIWRRGPDQPPTRPPEPVPPKPQ